MITRHIAAGLCVLVIGAATLVAAPPSAPDLARQGPGDANIRLRALLASQSPLRRIDVQPSDHLSRAEQLASMDPSWPRWFSPTDFGLLRRRSHERTRQIA